MTFRLARLLPFTSPTVFWHELVRRAGRRRLN